MGKRHQTSRRRAYGRRQHELRERFDRNGIRDGQPIRVDVFQTEAYDDASEPFGAFEFAGATGIRFALGD
jgi:hypothetical protein